MLGLGNKGSGRRRSSGYLIDPSIYIEVVVEEGCKDEIVAGEEDGVK